MSINLTTHSVPPKLFEYKLSRQNLQEIFWSYEKQQKKQPKKQHKHKKTPTPQHLK